MKIGLNSMLDVCLFEIYSHILLKIWLFKISTTCAFFHDHIRVIDLILWAKDGIQYFPFIWNNLYT